MSSIQINSYVEISPHYDLWMRGATHGTVTAIKWETARVKFGNKGLRKQYWFPLEHLSLR